MSECMKNFEINKERIIKIIIPIFDNYKITKEIKDSISNFIKNK